MKKPRLFPGAVHAIALPSGAYAVRYSGSHIETHTGVLAFPPSDDVGYLDMTDVDGIIDANGVKAYKIAGQGQHTYDAWLWDGGWTPQGPNNGSYPACFDGFGVLHIVRPGPGVSSQGYRFPDVTGDLVMGDETVNSATTLAYMLRVSRLYEWTYYAGIAFGQGDSGGLCVQVNDGDHRMLCTGSIHDVRVRYSVVSGVYAIAFYVAGNGVLWDGEHVQNASVLCWMTAPELRASLPPYPPIDVPVDPPDPPDPPEPPMPDLNLRADVEAERAKYPAVLTEDQPAKILNAVAWKNRADGWGLSAKPNGHHVISPQGVYVAYDILHHKPTNKLFGCFTDELKATVNWGEEAYHNDPQGRPWVAPIQPDSVPVDPGGPTDPGEPAPVPVDLTPILNELASLKAQLAGLQRTADAISDKVMQPTPPTPAMVKFPAYVGALGYRIRLTPEEQK